ncbi:MAG: hypothetical protein FWG75_03155 [Cystobacterineae bacterium]|nr:hypothetical protein [Cystobacterineae bacterium]
MWPFLFALVQATAPFSPEVSAEILQYQELSQEAWAEGNVEWRVEHGRLTAQRLNASQKTGWVSAEGQVVMRWADAAAQWVVLADLIHIRLKARGDAPLADGAEGRLAQAYEVEEIVLENGIWIQKHGVEAKVLLESTAQEALQLGKNGLSLRLTRMRQQDGLWELENFGFVPCDCDTTKPNWHLESSRGTLDIEGQRAHLLSTFAYIGEVPIFWVPWISLPLSSRQTGLLFPMFFNSTHSGFSMKQPLFITLGRSADLSLTPGWTLGTQNAYGTKGPSLGMEFRYRPSEDIEGNLALEWLWDMRERRSPVDAGYTGELGEPKKQRGLRLGTHIKHRQSIGEYGHVLADIALSSDGYLPRDFEAELLLRAVEYTRSQLGLSYEGPRVDVLLDVGYLQNLRWGYPLLGNAQLLRPPRIEPGTGALQVVDPLKGPNTLQRFPALNITLREHALGEGFSFLVQGSFVRLAPWRGLSGDEGPDAREGDDRIWINGRWERLSIQCMQRRLYAPSWGDGFCPEDMPFLEGKNFQGDGRYQPGEREARDRLGLLPTLKYQKRFLGGGAGIAASLALRQDIWLGELSGRWFSRGYPLLKLQAEGSLSKELWEGVWHTLTPQAELRWIAAQWGKVPVGYDEIDLAIPRGYRGLELGLRLRQSLWQRSADKAAEELLSLEVAQAVGVANEPGIRLGDTLLKVSSRWRFLETDLYTGFNLKQGQLSRIGAMLRTRWADTLGGHIRYDLFQLEGEEWSRRGVDMLIGSAPVIGDSTPNLGIGAWAKIEGFRLRYQMSFFHWYEKFRLAQHLLALGWTPACNCFGLELYALQTAAPNNRGGVSLGMPNFGFSFQLQGIGGWGVRQ